MCGISVLLKVVMNRTRTNDYLLSREMPVAWEFAILLEMLCQVDISRVANLNDVKIEDI